MPRSSIYGLRVHSDRTIPRVQPSESTAGIDLHVTLGLLPNFLSAIRDSADRWHSSACLDELGRSKLVIWKLAGGAWFHMCYSDGTEFLVDHFGTRLWATWPEPLTVEDTATYLLGPVIGFVLLLRGTHCLHASAVNVGGRAIALVGPAGAGKSTTAAAFAKRGYRVLSDDVVTLDDESGELMVHPAYPCIRLWPDSAEALFGAADALPLLTPNWDKRYLDLAGDEHRFQASALPLAAIYVLGERSGDAAAPRVEAVAPQAAMIELVGNAYAPHLKDKAARAGEFRVFSRVVATLPVRRAIPGADLAHVDRLCGVILDDFRARPQPRAATDTAEHIECV